MDGLLLPILIAATVALAVWGLARLVTGAALGEKRKLQQRLSTEGRLDLGSVSAATRVTLQMGDSGLPPLLGRVRFFQSLNRKLVQAYPEARLTRFLALAVGIGLGGTLVAMTVTGSPLGALCGGLAGLYAPVFVLNAKRAKRQRKMTDQLPEALDFLCRILRAGHSLSTGLQMMSDELPAPLCEEFRKCYDQHSLGQSLEDCLKDMAARVESTDFAFFVTAVLIQRTTGGDLSEVLRNIAGMIRGRIRLAQQVKAKTAEGRFTGYVMVAFPAIMLFIACTMNPEHGKILFDTDQGRMLLGITAGLQIVGMFAIKKITTVKV